MTTITIEKNMKRKKTSFKDHVELIKFLLNLEDETNLKQLKDSEITPAMEKKAEKILQQDEELLINI